jgi:hypothetical protein
MPIVCCQIDGSNEIGGSKMVMNGFVSGAGLVVVGVVVGAVVGVVVGAGGAFVGGTTNVPGLVSTGDGEVVCGGWVV